MLCDITITSMFRISCIVCVLSVPSTGSARQCCGEPCRAVNLAVHSCVFNKKSKYSKDCVLFLFNIVLFWSVLSPEIIYSTKSINNRKIKA